MEVYAVAERLDHGNTRTPFQNDPRILQQTSRNNEKTPDRKPYALDDVDGKSLTQQGPRFKK